jgi:hypothetical protein
LVIDLGAGTASRQAEDGLVVGNLQRMAGAIRGLTREVQHQQLQVMCNFQTFHSAPQPNESFNADANIGHRFAILMANVGALRPYRASGAG